MLNKINRRLAAVVLGLGLAIGGAGAAVAATAGGPALTSPAGTVGPYYSGAVHECVNAVNESVSYFELHTTQQGNCAAGYRQVVVNELTPAFTFSLNGVNYTCTAATAQTETALSCTPVPVPSPSPSVSPSSTPTPSVSVS
jgi:hypothetical protein